MTRQDLFDWITLEHKCEVIILPEGKARCIYFKNNKTKGTATLDSPIDDRRVRPVTIVAICVSLGIEIPACAQDAEIVISHYRNKDYKKGR